MKLATLANASPDGQLVVVSADLTRYASAGGVAPHLQAALDQWDVAAPKLAELYRRLNEGDIAGKPFEAEAARAPLPRAYQWIDGAGYLSHLERVRTAKGSKDAELQDQRPLMYQGASDSLAGPRDNIILPEDNLAPDFEAEIAVITGPVPMGVDHETAASSIRLITICNDVSFRRLVADDLQGGFGFFHAKPATSFAPIVATPDEFGDAWSSSRLHLKIKSFVNGTLYGQPNAGADVAFDFADLIVAAARTRELGCGTIIGSGTVANAHDNLLPVRGDEPGFSCIVEARTAEKLVKGKASTPFLKAGDRVHILLEDEHGNSPVGDINQMVVAHGAE